MEFRETLLAAQKNQQQKSCGNIYYKARFDPPKKEQKQKDKLSANIQKFLAKKDEEEKQRKLEAQRKKEELFAMRDPKAIRKIQKSLKVFKSANKSVLADAVDRDHTAVTRAGPEQPDQDDYGYESQEAAAFYDKMMEKYSKIPDEPKFPVGNNSIKKDLNGTRERVKHALQHEDEHVPHKRRRKGENGDKELSPPLKYEPEKKKDEKSEKPKVKKMAPPPMDFNQLLKIAEQKKCEPVEAVTKKLIAEPEPERLMTKKQKREYEEEMARRQRRQERIEAEKGGSRKILKEEKPDKKIESGSIGRIPKIVDKIPINHKNINLKGKTKQTIDKDKSEMLQRDREKIKIDREKAEREKEQLDRDRLDRLKAERDRIDRDIDRLNRDRLDKSKSKQEIYKPEKTKSIDKVSDRPKSNLKEHINKQDLKKSLDLKSLNTYRIDKNCNDRKFVIPNKNTDNKYCSNSNGSQGKPIPKTSKEQSIPQKNGLKDKVVSAKQKDLFGSGVPKTNGHSKPESGKGLPFKRLDDKKSGPESVPSASRPQSVPSKSKLSNSFDFDKHINSLGKNETRKHNGIHQFPPGDVKRKHPNDIRKRKRAVQSDSEYDSEMDDFIDNAEVDFDYSKHIKEMFGYDKSKWRDIDDDDDPNMESNFAQQQREEYISKKIGIMEDLEDMRMEAMEKKKAKKRRRISDD